MARNDKFVIVHDTKIESMWGLSAGSYVYEGCSVLLSDGRPCALGKKKRKLRRQNADSPMGPHSRGRTAHVCSLDGAGTHMYCFAVQIGDVVIQVNEEVGERVMAMPGSLFKTKVDSCPDEIRSVCADVLSELWTIAYVKDQDGCRALAMDRSSRSSMFLSKREVISEEGSDLREAPRVQEVIGKVEGSQLQTSLASNVTNQPKAQMGPIRRLKDACMSFGGEIVLSLKSMTLGSDADE